MTTRKHRRGLSTIVITIILIVIGVTLAIAAYALTSGIMGGSTSTPSIQYQASYIRVDASTGKGVVYVNIFNNGPGVLQMQTLSLTDKNGAQYVITFNYATKNATDTSAASTSTDKANTVGGGIVLSGSTGVAVSSSNILVIPSGGSVSITLSFDGTSGHDLGAIFDIGGVYNGFIHPLKGADIPFSARAAAA